MQIANLKLQICDWHLQFATLRSWSASCERELQIQHFHVVIHETERRTFLPRRGFTSQPRVAASATLGVMVRTHFYPERVA
jgi:hypothetical protein